MSPIPAACLPALLFSSFFSITCAAVRELAFSPCTYYMCLVEGARLSALWAPSGCSKSCLHVLILVIFVFALVHKGFQGQGALEPLRRLRLVSRWSLP